MLRRAAILATLMVAGVCALVLASAAQAKTSSLLWATVNVCDTKAHPDTIGIRGSMPGTGVRAQEMFMRFQLQYLATDDSKWHNIGAAGDSGFIDVGSAKYRKRQSGRNFTVAPPKSGAFHLRGAVTFEWRLGTDVVQRARMKTSAGRGKTAGADPAAFSAATCDVRK